MSLLFAFEATSGFHKSFLFFFGHLREVDVHGIRITFLFLFAGVPSWFELLGFFLLFPVSQCFGHSPSGVVLLGVFYPLSKRFRDSFHLYNLFSQWGGQSFPKGMA